MAQHSHDLVLRTYVFAQTVRVLVNRLPKMLSNFEDVRQLVRASGSVAANYLEAQEGVSRKDFFYRIKVCRKEVREAGLWLRLLIIEGDSPLAGERERLVGETVELRKIFSSIAAREDPD